ncbi:MAG: 16S rRNA (cytidine(1402)-2'-O)-methyltransferase [Spirochaetaceae bacterium]|nr:16S rRNA (cytidine(1402)-2'-O)-methyltransferase [Spirochaetaceae bacterium]
MGVLYVIGTPIGNLEDITLRALETLKTVDIVACEDTRHTLKLLTNHDIRKPLIACHANDEKRAARKIVALLDDGKKVAYCTDAGTPGLSDPGAVLVRCAREAGHEVVPVPGPSAFAALLSVSGFGGRSITFDGFQSPRASRRKARLAELLQRNESFIIYESPFRIAKLMRELAELAPGRMVCIGRELTKIHEEVCVGTALELADRFASNRNASGSAKGPGGATAANPGPASGAGEITEKGEFAIMVYGLGAEGSETPPVKDEEQ